MKVKRPPRSGSALVQNVNANTHFRPSYARARAAREEMNMTNNEDMSLKAIALCRDFNNRMAARQAANGIAPADIAIGAIYAAVDVAEQIHGSLPLALGWARRALDVMEDGLRFHADDADTIQ